MQLAAQLASLLVGQLVFPRVARAVLQPVERSVSARGAPQVSGQAAVAAWVLVGEVASEDACAARPRRRCP